MDKEHALDGSRMAFVCQDSLRPGRPGSAVS